MSHGFRVVSHANEALTLDTIDPHRPCAQHVKRMGMVGVHSGDWCSLFQLRGPHQHRLSSGQNDVLSTATWFDLSELLTRHFHNCFRKLLKRILDNRFNILWLFHDSSLLVIQQFFQSLCSSLVMLQCNLVTANIPCLNSSLKINLPDLLSCSFLLQSPL